MGRNLSKRGNGEGTIFKREIKGKTYWIAEYTIEMYDKNGKQKVIRTNW